MLVQLGVMEQRYHAVMEVLSGMAITEVAERLGVHRNSVHAWVRHYQENGLAGLADRSHRAHRHPWQLAPGIEAKICEMRRAHHKWGPQRLAYELDKKGVSPLPSRSSIYRVLVRHHLVEARRRKRRREDYTSWEREAPMDLWQLDVMGSVFLVDGTECKLVTGIDDHSRFCVLAMVVARATGRAVCSAFAGALSEYGVPDEVLTDNGRQFTGRFTKPRMGEVLFERICRDNGIIQRHTGIRSPTTTGKIERLHQTIQLEVLAEEGPFEDVLEAQEAMNRWRHQYNEERPHQSLDMATPASRFRPVPEQERALLPLKLPANLSPAPGPASDQGIESLLVPAPGPKALETGAAGGHHGDAIEIERVVPTCGNLVVRPQQLWLGPRLAGRTVTLWIDTKTVHVTLDGRRLKTLPSRLLEPDLMRLRRDGARSAGPPPAPPSAQQLARGAAIEVDRPVNACGLVALGGMQFGVGQVLAGQRVTLRLEGDLIHVVSDGVLRRTILSPLEPEQLTRLRGARLAGPSPVTGGPVRVRRRVSCRGAISITTQRVQVGIVHAHKIVTVELHDTVVRVVDDNGEIVKVLPRTNNKEVIQHKAHGRDARLSG